MAQLAQARQVRVKLGQRLIQLLSMQVQLRTQRVLGPAGSQHYGLPWFNRLMVSRKPEKRASPEWKQVK